MTDLQPATISIGSQILLGADDVSGVQWYFTSIDGWHKPAEMNVDRVQRVVSHGEFPQRGHRMGRTITLEGSVAGPTVAATEAALAKLSALLADGTFDTFTFAGVDRPTQTARVQLLDMDINWRGKVEGFPDYQIQLLAPDPFKYGTVSSGVTGLFTGNADGTGFIWDAFPSGNADFNTSASAAIGSATISNPGTAPASVKFTVTGPTPASGFRITDLATGKRISYLGTVIPAGSSLILDGSNGSVLIDGVTDRSGDVVVEAWPTVAAGGVGSYFFETLGGTTATTLTAACTATYW